MSPDATLVSAVAEYVQELVELRRAPVHIADDVEPAMVGLPVVPERLTHDADGGNRLFGLEHVHVPEAFALQVSQRSLELAALLPDHVPAEVAITALPVARLAHTFGQVEHDGDGQHVISPRELDEWLPRLGLHVGCIDDSEQPALQLLAAM